MKQFAPIDSSPPLAVLKQISPSRFHTLQKCALREVWATCKAPAYLPVSGQSVLGTVIHRMIEEALMGRFARPYADSLEGRWSKLIQEAEAGLADNLMNRHLIPLSTSVLDYYVRKAKAIKQITKIAAESHTSSSGGTGHHNSEVELLLRSKDELIVGRCDNITHTHDGVVIRDFKTGNIWDDEDAFSLKSAYIEQMQIYGALYHNNYSEDNIKLELVPMEGSPVHIDFDVSKGEYILRIIVNKLHEVNSIISNVFDKITKERLLANPTNHNCRFCTFRPCCGSYLRTKPDFEPAETPFDLIGVCHTVTRLGNGTVLLKLLDAKRQDILLTIRGLSGGQDRHPVLFDIKPHEWIGVFNLIPSQQSITFESTRNTTIHRYTPEFIQTLG